MDSLQIKKRSNYEDEKAATVDLCKQTSVEMRFLSVSRTVGRFATQQRQLGMANELDIPAMIGAVRGVHSNRALKRLGFPRKKKVVVERVEPEAIVVARDAANDLPFSVLRTRVGKQLPVYTGALRCISERAVAAARTRVHSARPLCACDV